MTPIVALVLGLLIGWLVEWVIDWIYWRRRSQALQECADQYKQKLASLEGELLSLKSEFQPLQEKANQLELEKAQLELQWMNTQQELEQCRQLELGKAQLETRSAQFQQEFDTFSSPPAVEEPVIPDNLQEIKGIGLVISRRLNQNNIYTFEQLAAQTPEYLREILGDMVQRLANEDSLIEQARQFALRKLSKGADGQ
jgi:predicted flap endonuclease-1-like 5' DNA nuclease